jgi:hypothetical protein
MRWDESGEAAARHLRPGLRSLRSPAAAGGIGGPSVAVVAAAAVGGIGALRPALAQGTHRAAGFLPASAAGGGV